MDSLTPLEQQTERTSELFRQGYAAGSAFPKPKHNRMTVCGMGGSILGAELFQTFAARALPDLDVVTWQTYGLPPKHAQSDTYCISYSGNTEETLSAFRTACAGRGRPACLAHTGMLAAQAKKMHAPFQMLPDTVVPRLVAPFVFGFFVGLYCHDMGTKRGVARLSSDIDRANASMRPQAIKLAKKQILLYTPVSSLSLAHLWEIHLNETAGLLAFGDDIPDIDHHTLAALKNASGRSAFHALFLINGTESKRMQKRIALTQYTFKRLGIAYSPVAIASRSTIASLLAHARLASMTAIAIARKTRFNPFTNTIQATFKKKLRGRP